jgi:hypothetical protein
MRIRPLKLVVASLAVLAAAQVGATPKPRVNQICLEDFHKLCPTQELGRGVVIRCARAHHDALTANCRSAVEAADAVNTARKAAKASRRASATRTSSATSAATGAN